ncbi:hypothetical protein [Xylanibacter rodentium]|uniref:hypothetical protein n=2 Tax=Xylanibacter rodentium TaxID=2736289 RepID=UPI0025977DC5|nr:hypothetical protein [Xylanibacter rodentium]
MEQSNISRDHLAMEAMKVLLPYHLKEDLTLVERIRRLLGLPVRVRTYNSDALAAEAYQIADSMIGQR